MAGPGRPGRTSKGDRRLLPTRPPIAVWEAIHELAAGAGTNASQYVSDLLAAHVDRPDLVSGRQTQEVLPLAM